MCLWKTRGGRRLGREERVRGILEANTMYLGTVETPPPLSPLLSPPSSLPPPLPGVRHSSWRAADDHRRDSHPGPQVSAVCGDVWTGGGGSVPEERGEGEDQETYPGLQSG